MKNAASWFSNVARAIRGQGATYRELATPEQIRAYLAAAESNGGSSPLGVAAVWACVQLLSRSIATLPLALYKVEKERHVIAADNPAHELVAYAPNSISTPFEFLQLMVAHLLLKGNFYAEKVQTTRRITALLPLEPGRVVPKIGPSGVLEYEYFEPGKPARRFAQHQILHVRGLTTDGLVGLSVLGAARRAIAGAIATENYGAAMFKNGARPSGVLEIPTELSEEAQKRLRDQFDEMYSGVENAQKTMVLEAGLQWKPISLDAEDSQFIESRKFSRSEIAMFFGVPPHLIGDVERGTSWGSGIEQQNRGFLIYTLRPYLMNIAQAFARDLIPAKDRANYLFKFDTSDLERADFGPRQTGLEIQRRNRVISRNDWRKAEGLNPLEDPEADDASESAPAPSAPAPSAGGAGESDPAPESQGSEPPAGAGDPSPKRISPALRLVP